MDNIPDDAAAYELHIALAGIEPAIWRRVRVRADSMIADLHYTIQLLMNWGDYHLHRFVINGCEYGIARTGGVWFDDDAEAVMLSHFRFYAGDGFVYEYDFGDRWEHHIVVEGILPIDPGIAYPALYRRAPCGSA